MNIFLISQREGNIQKNLGISKFFLALNLIDSSLAFFDKFLLVCNSDDTIETMDVDRFGCSLGERKCFLSKDGEKILTNSIAGLLEWLLGFCLVWGSV